MDVRLPMPKEANLGGWAAAIYASPDARGVAAENCGQVKPTDLHLRRLPLAHGANVVVPPVLGNPRKSGMAPNLEDMSSAWSQFSSNSSHSYVGQSLQVLDPAILPSAAH
jgi:hypothetical protein